MRKPSCFYFAILLMLLPLPVFADDESEDSAELLGWIAVGCGVVANIPFIKLTSTENMRLLQVGRLLRWQGTSEFILKQF